MRKLLGLLLIIVTTQTFAQEQNDPGYGQDTLEQMKEKLKKLSAISLEDMPPAQISIPDYPVAHQPLSTSKRP